jgi:hypothetical protein
MTKEQWISDNYTMIPKWLKGVTRGRSSELFEDFCHEMMLAFLENPKSQEAVNNGQGRFYLVRIAINNWRSATSPWAKQEWGQPLSLVVDLQMEDEAYNLEDDVILELLIGILDEMHLGEIEEYYMSLVVMIYHTLDGNFSEMSRRLDIPRTSLGKVYREAIETITHRLHLKMKQLEDGTIRLNHDTNLVIDRWNELCSTAERKASQVHARAVQRGFFRTL